MAFEHLNRSQFAKGTGWHPCMFWHCRIYWTSAVLYVAEQHPYWGIGSVVLYRRALPSPKLQPFLWHLAVALRSFSQAKPGSALLNSWDLHPWSYKELKIYLGIDLSTSWVHSALCKIQSEKIPRMRWSDLQTDVILKLGCTLKLSIYLNEVPMVVCAGLWYCIGSTTESFIIFVVNSRVFPYLFYLMPM